MLDLLIKKGKILDGSGNPWYTADIGVTGDEIVSIAKEINDTALDTISAEGFYIAPGFIDMHTHWELRVFAHPAEEEKLRQGITTSLIGQDGLSVAPVNDDVKGDMKLRVSGLLGSYVDDWNWSEMSEYLGVLEKAHPATNYMMLVPHGNIRSMVMGWEDRPSNTKEIEMMKSLLSDSMDKGACGFSTGLIYPPGMYAQKEELVELCRVTGLKGGFFVVHMRDEGNNLIQSIKEVGEICLEAKCPLHISHLKVAGKKNWGKSEKALDVIESIRNLGLEVTFDQYPYTAGSTMLDALIPPRFHSGGTHVLMDRLRDPKISEEIRQVIDGDNREKWENWVEHCGWEGILINSVNSDTNRFTEGKTISEIARITAQEPFEVLRNLLLSEEGHVTMTQFYGTEADVRKFIKSDNMTLCTDSIAGGKPHPRSYGSTCRFIRKYVLENADISLTQAIQRMTSRPAQVLGLKDRGLIREGMKADLVIFNPSRMADKATYEQPCRYSEGVSTVLVNGQIALSGDGVTLKRNGRVLK